MLFDDSDRIRPILGGGNTNLEFNSFAGTDIQCFLFDVEGPASKINAINNTSLTNDQKALAREKAIVEKGVKPFGELQTITVSVASSFGPTRRLGEREVVEYLGGARTIAGSLIFAVLNRDVFARYMINKTSGKLEQPWRSPHYVDEIPEFNILVQGGNEFGHFASGLLIGVKLTNFGTTFSVDDLYTEATYNYVARHYVPFTDDWQRSVYEHLIVKEQEKPLSSTVQDDNSFLEVHGEMVLVNQQLMAWWQTLPPSAQASMRDVLPTLQNNLFKDYLKRKMDEE